MELKKKILSMLLTFMLSFAILLNGTAIQAAEKHTIIPKVDYVNAPTLEYTAGDTVNFNLYSPNYGRRVQYRVVLWDNNKKQARDLWTTGDRYYTNWMPYGNNNFNLHWRIDEPGSYRITVYVKRAGIQNSNTALKGVNCDSYMESKAFVVKAKTITFDKDGQAYGSVNVNKVEAYKNDISITAENVTFNNARLEGNLTITGDNAVIRNVNIIGKIVIDPGKDGSCTLDNITAKDIEVLSGGQNSIHIKDSDIGTMNVDSQSPVRIEVDGDTEIVSTSASGYVIFDRKNGTYGTITITKAENGKSVVEFRGDIKDKIEVETAATIKTREGSSISNLVINTKNDKDKVKLEGKFDKVEINSEVEIEAAANTRIENVIANNDAVINLDKTASVNNVDEKGNEIVINGGNNSESTTPTVNNGGGSSGGGGYVPPIVAVSDVSIIGIPKVGAELTAVPVPPGATVNYQWEICDKASGTYTKIGGATTNKYIPKPGDLGKFIKVSATGTGSYTGTTTSGATGAVGPAAPDYSINYIAEKTNEIVPVTDEYSFDGGKVWIKGSGTELELIPGQNVQFRIAASGEIPAGDIQTLVIASRPAKPSFKYAAGIDDALYGLPVGASNLQARISSDNGNSWGSWVGITADAGGRAVLAHAGGDLIQVRFKGIPGIAFCGESTEQYSKKAISELSFGDKVVDNSWMWEFKTGNDYTGAGEIKPVTWIVAAKNHYGVGSGVTLLSEELIGRFIFDNRTYIHWGGVNHWGDSNLIRPWLNSSGVYAEEGFYHSFSDEFKASVLKVSIPNMSQNGSSKYVTQDKIFIPSTTELGISSDDTHQIGTVYTFIESADDRIAKLGSNNSSYWSRSPYSNYKDIVHCFLADGSQGVNIAFENLQAYKNNAIRPALNLASDVLVSGAPSSGGVYEIYYPQGNQIITENINIFSTTIVTFDCNVDRAKIKWNGLTVKEGEIDQLTAKGMNTITVPEMVSGENNVLSVEKTGYTKCIKSDVIWNSVNSITITGDAATVVAGCKLQMRAAVQPANATNKTVIWSVTCGTGMAKIDVNGLLTTAKAGTVTVKAINEASGVVGQLVVTVKPTEGKNVQVAETAVIALETAAKEDLTIESNLTAAETAVIAANTEINKLAAGDDRIVLEGRVATAAGTVTAARIAFYVAVAAGKVTALETAAAKDLTIESNLTAAEAAVTAANTAVGKLAAGADRTALEGRATTAAGTVTAARTVFDAAVAAVKVTALETAAKEDLTIESNLTAAEATVTAANTAVGKLAAGADRIALEGRVAKAAGTVTAARTVFDAAVAAEKVTALETAAKEDLTIESNLTAAEAAVTAANTAVGKLAAGDDRTKLEGKVATAAGTVTAARTAFDAVVEAAKLEAAKTAVTVLETAAAKDLKEEVNLTAAEKAVTAAVIAIRAVAIGNPGRSELITRFITASGTVETARINKIAAGITTITAPVKDATRLILPTVAFGYKVTIKSSDKTGVVALSGTITPPNVETTVALVLTVTKIIAEETTDTADTISINVVIPAKTVY